MTIEMKIIGCDIIGESMRRFQNNMPYELMGESIVFNLGNSDLDIKEFPNHVIINHPNNVEKCANKKKMFTMLQRNKVRALKYFNLETETGKAQAFKTVAKGKRIVMRRGRDIEIIRTKKALRELINWGYNYATIKEDKRGEWRVVIFRGEILRTMIKIGQGFAKKQWNCDFIDDAPPIEVLIEAKKAQYALGIDYCGVDVLLNRNDEVKIIEVNSAPGTHEKTVRRIYDILLNEIENENLYCHGKL